MSNKFIDKARQLGFGGLNPLGMRRSNITALVSVGTPPPAVSPRVGHANTRTTLDVYTHASDEDKAAATQKADELMSWVLK